jgi:hypothetical protein
MALDIDVKVSGFSVQTAYYLAKACALTYEDPFGSGVTELGLGRVAAPFQMGELHGFVAVSDAFAMVVFRGTDSIATWLTDGRIIQLPRRPYPGLVHRGFADALEAAWPRIVAMLPALGSRALYVAGHSLGGALATLAEGLPVRAAYTYGSPRVGNLAFYDGYTPVNYRFVNNNDLVPHVPIEFLLLGVPLEDRALFGHPVQGLVHFVYKHVGTLKYLDRQGRLGEGMSDWDQKKEFLANALVRGAGNFELAAIADHHIANYVRSIGSNLPEAVPDLPRPATSVTSAGPTSG